MSIENINEKIDGEENISIATVEPGNELKKHRKYFSKLGWMYMLGTLIILAASSVVGNIAGRVYPNFQENVNVYITVASISMYIIGMPLMILLVKTIPGEKLEKHSMSFGKYIQAIIICFAIMYLSNIVGTILTTIIGLLKGGVVSNPIAELAIDMNPLISILYMVICAPIMEELIFRKLIVDRTVKYGEGWAVLLSGLFFGLFHGNLNQFAYAFTMGLYLAFIYVKTGKLGYTIGLHMIVNFFGSVVATYMLKGIDLQAYLEASQIGPEAVMEAVMNSLSGWIMYGLYVCVIIVFVVIGVVLLVVKRNQLTLKAGRIQLPKANMFKAVFVNTGMIVFSVFWIVNIIMQLFQ